MENLSKIESGAKPASQGETGLVGTILETLRSVALGARDNVNGIERKVKELRAKREKVNTAIPHVDDLADWICRNIDRHRDFFMERAATFLHQGVLKEHGWSKLDDPEVWDNGFGIFRIDHNSASGPKGYLRSG